MSIGGINKASSDSIDAFAQDDICLDAGDACRPERDIHDEVFEVSSFFLTIDDDGDDLDQISEKGNPSRL